MSNSKESLRAAARLQAGEEVVSSGELSEQLGIVVQTDLIEKLGVQPGARIRNGVYWKRSDIPRICARLATYFGQKAAVLPRVQ